MPSRRLSTTLNLALAASLAYAGLAVTAASALADEPPADQKMVVKAIVVQQALDTNDILGAVIEFSTSSNGKAPEGTHISTSVYSCGRKLQEQGYTMQINGYPVGTFSFTAAQQKRIGRSLQYVATFHQPGYDTYTVKASKGDFQVKRPSCAKIRSGGSAKACHATRWSKKLPTSQGESDPIAGSAVRISETRATCPVSYTWTLDGRTTAGHRTTLHLKKAWTGQRLAVTVRAAKKGHRSATRVVRYGVVRAR